MSALDNAMKLKEDEVMSKIAELGIEEYGICRQRLSALLADAVEESREEGRIGIVCALDNADTKGVLLEVLKAEPEKVMEGISIAAYALGTKDTVLYLPEYAAQYAEMEQIKQASKSYQVQIQIGLTDVRAEKGKALLHIMTAFELAERFAGEWEDQVFVSVNGAPVKKVACDTQISEITELEDAKAVLIGYGFYTPEEASVLPVSQSPNGVIWVLTEKDCVVTETARSLSASRGQSCGKCVFCREGLLQLQYMQNEIADGKGRPEFLDMIQEIGEAMSISTPCTMGQVSAQIALTAVEKYVHEYEAHIKKKECPAGVCFSAETIYINPKTCEGCGECMDVCPEDCIEGKAGYIHMIDDFDCSRCGKCVEVCGAEAVVKTSGKLPKLPDRLTKVGRFKKR